MKKLYFLVLLFVVGSVNAQVIEFANANFKNKLLQASPTNAIAKDLQGNSFKIDANNDGEIQEIEAAQVRELNVSNSQIVDLTGIEFFTALKVLLCQYNFLTALDVSNNVLLESLNCSGNRFVTLEVANLANLSSLQVAPNSYLQSLKVNYLPQLTLLKLHNNLYSSQLENLVTLDCSNNGLTSLQLYYGNPGIQSLKHVDCSNNALTTLDIKHVFLKTFNCANNLINTLETTYNTLSGITSLNISNNNLTSFTIHSELLTDFQFLNNPLETMVFTNYGSIQMFDFSAVPTLKSLAITGFSLQSLILDNPLLNTLKIETSIVEPVIIGSMPLLKHIEVVAEGSEFVFSGFDAFTAFLPYDYENPTETFFINCKKVIFKDIINLTTIVDASFEVEEMEFENLPNLTSLTMHVNTKQTALKFDNLPLLQNLEINENFFENETCIDLTIQEFPSLNNLKIGRVKINNLVIANLPNLTHFEYLGGSCYETINELVLDDLPSLIELSVMDPLLDYLTITNMPNLYSLKLESNEFKNLVLTNLPQLHDLDYRMVWHPSDIPPLPVLNISNFPNLYSVYLKGVTGNLILQNLPSLYSFVFDYSYMMSVYDFYPIDYIFNDLPSLYHLELNAIQTNNLVMTNLPNLNTIKMVEATIGNSYTFQNLPVETIALDYVKLQSISFSNLSNIKNVSLINFYDYLNSLTFTNTPTLETFKLKGNGIENNLNSLNFSGFQNLKSIIVSYLLSNLILNDMPSLNYLNTSGNRFSTLNLVSLPNLEEFIHNGNDWQEFTINLKNLPSLSKVDVSFNQEYLDSLDLSECPNLKELHFVRYSYPVEYDFPLDYLNLRNGNPNLEILEVNPVKSICVDDEDEKELLQNLSLNLGDTVFTSYCDLNPAGTFFLFQGNNIFASDNNGCDVSDIQIPNIKYSVVSQNGINNVIANTSGIYSIPVQAGSHTITPVLENPALFTISPASAEVTFPETTSPFTQNFCITPNGLHPDLEVTILPTTPARPGFDADYKIIIKNKGNIQQSGSVSFAYNDAILDYIVAEPLFTTQAEGSLSWAFANLEPFEIREINVTLNVNSPMETPAVNGDDVLTYTTTITSDQVDELPLDNTFTLSQIVVNSFDPNDKTCLEGTSILPSMIGQYVHYMIRFENTGTFAAENIVVKDMIDATKFDVSSLITLGGSHPYVTRIAGNKVEFIFEGINLPFDDANNDGYLVFKIKTLPTLVLGDSFSNTASIYFDYNHPIITEPAITTFAELGREDFAFNNYFTLYPNPTIGILNITAKQAVEMQSISIYNTLGQMLVSVPNAKGISTVDVSSLANGNYFIKIVSDKGTSNAKFIKQ